MTQPLAQMQTQCLGTRYHQGCRCLRCRVGEAAKDRQRKAVLRCGGSNVVDANGAAAHLKYLSERGVGRKAVSAACDVSPATIKRIRQGKRSYILRSTAERIFEVTPEAFGEGNRVDARPMWKQIEQLLREGFTKSELARRLGLNKLELRWNRRRVTGRTVVMVDKFYRTVMAGGDDE